MRRALLLFAAAALLLPACAGAPPAPSPAEPGAVTPRSPAAEAPAPPPGAVVFDALAARFTERALRAEKAGDLRRALDSWKIVAGLRPQAAEPARRVADLGARAAAAAARHFADGSARLKEGASDAARRSFLLALAADPDHAEALDALKRRVEPDAEPHTVVAGETFESIARDRYGDAAKAPIVARINDLDPAGTPVPGTVLTLPSLTAPVAKAAAKRGAEPADPQDTAYDTEPAAITPEATAPPAAPAPAPPPVTAAPPAPAAIEAPKPPDPAELERRRKEKAEEFYTSGVRFFVNQKLDEAIQSWEQTLALNPDHPKAPKDIEKARALQKKLRDLK